ncbi:MAG: hypothetical protein Q9195_008324 [Heterodermia aff. obscurata]
MLSWMTTLRTRYKSYRHPDHLGKIEQNPEPDDESKVGSHNDLYTSERITPWAAMSNNWKKSGACILINYIDDLEIKSLWTSFRHRHWGVFLGLTGGFLCGSLVPFASGLFYVDPAHIKTNNTTLVRTSKFDFNTSSSAFDSSNPYIDQPMAALAAKRRFDSLLPTWTTNEYAFESFNLSDAPRNVSISGNSTAFTANLDCDILRYNSEVVRAWYTNNGTGQYSQHTPSWEIHGLAADVRLLPNIDDMAKIGCSIPSSYYPMVIFPRPSDPTISVQPAAWLNVTTCSNVRDERLTFTIMELLNYDSQSIDQSNISFRATGLLYKPKLEMSVVGLTVNASTAELVDVKLLSNTSDPVTLGINLTMLSAVINRPAASELFYTGIDSSDYYYDRVRTPDNQWDNLMQTGLLLPYLERVGVDPWFTIVTNGNYSRFQEYSANMSLLGVDSSQLFRNMLAQTVNSNFRVTDSTPISGLVDRQDQKILLHLGSLRCLQIVFGFLGVVAICCATILRPKSCLLEDPGTLAAVAVIVAASLEFENHLNSVNLLESRDIQETLQGAKIKFASTESAGPAIQVAKRSSVELPKELYKRDQGYRPVTLYPLFRFFIIAMTFGMLSALATVLRLSDSKEGFTARTSVRSLAWSYTPSAVLVLLGYAIQGTESSAQTLRSYIALQRGSISGKKSLLLSSANLSALDGFHMSFWQAGSWALYASTLVSVVYPAIKITAAGLYTRHLTQHSFLYDMVIDQSLISNLDQIPPEPGNYNSFVAMAMAFATWSFMPQMQFHPLFESGSSLVFSNISDTPLPKEVELALSHGGEVSLNIPAVEIEVNCSALSRENFRVVREGSIVQVLCQSQRCRRYFPGFNESYASTYGTYESGVGWLGGYNLSAPSIEYAEIFAAFNVWVEGWTDPEDYNLAPISGIFMKVDDYELDETSTNESISITPKTIAGYSCTRTLNKVNVNVTYTRETQRDVQGVTLLPAAIVSFDRRSISTANNLPPYRTSNYQDHDAAFLERLFDPNYLPDAAKAAYISYTAQFINQLRHLALQHGNDTIERTATISEETDRIFQSRNITIALIVLLSFTIGCVIVSIWSVPRKPIIARAPNSIAAQVSLLAGSELVRRLREQRVNSVKDTKIWEEEVFSLGWWSSDDPYVKEGERKERWGIDIGEARLRNTLDKALVAPS